MSAVDPRRVGDVLPLTCDCRSPRHGRGIARCSDRDMVFELDKRDGLVVMVVVEDERMADAGPT